MDRNLAKALDEVSNKRFLVTTYTGEVEKMRELVDKASNSLADAEKVLAAQQVSLNTALLNLRKVMSGLDSEVAALPPIMDITDQVRREG